MSQQNDLFRVEPRGFAQVPTVIGRTQDEGAAPHRATATGHLTFFRAVGSPQILDGPTPAEQGQRRGRDGASDAEKHLTDHAPGWLLDALGDALLAFQGGDFTSEMVRHKAEQSEAVKGWLGVKGRENCFPGWWRSRIKLHRLVRVDRAPAIAKRSSRRGATLPYWRWPQP